jgi:hypothetical protein
MIVSSKPTGSELPVALGGGIISPWTGYSVSIHI